MKILPQHTMPRMMPTLSSNILLNIAVIVTTIDRDCQVMLKIEGYTSEVTKDFHYKDKSRA
jgi:hypothetical protein